MDLSIKERVFSGVMVRGICDRAYGSRISRNAWANWRQWAGVPSSRRSYTFEQLCFLYAVSVIRSSKDNQFRELKRSEIMTIAESFETHEMIAAFVVFVDNDFVVGKDAPIALKAKGVKVSLRTLYRNVPKFSANHVYRLEDLKGWAIA